MLVNLDFANDNILSCFFFFFLIIDFLILFNSCSYYSNYNPIAELVIPLGIPTKEAKAEMEAH